MQLHAVDLQREGSLGSQRNERQAMYAEYGKFTQDLRSSGAMVAPARRRSSRTPPRSSGRRWFARSGTFASERALFQGLSLGDVRDRRCPAPRAI